METWKKIAFVCAGSAATLLLLNALVEKGEKDKRSSTPTLKLKKGNINLNNPEYSMLVREQLVRNYQFFGEEGQERIRKGSIVIIGLMGIGSHLVNTLIRSGVEDLTIIDHGEVSELELDVSGTCFRDNLGKNRLLAFKEYLNDVCPHIRLNAIHLSKAFSFESVQEILNVLEQKVKDARAAESVFTPDYLINTIPGLLRHRERGLSCESVDPHFLQKLISLLPGIRMMDVSKKILNKDLICPSMFTLAKIESLDTPSFVLTTIMDPEEIRDNFYNYISSPVLSSTTALYISSLVLAALAHEPLNTMHPQPVTNLLLQKIHKKVKDLLIKQPEQKLVSLAGKITVEIVDRILVERFNWKCVESGRKAPVYRLVFWSLKKEYERARQGLDLELDDSQLVLVS